jgi:hypothetical protein
MDLVLRADGTGTFDGDAIRFAVEGDRLVTQLDGEKVVYRFRLEGAKLTLSDGDLDKPMTFARAGAGDAPPAPGGRAEPEVQAPAPSARPGSGTWRTQTPTGAALELRLDPDGTGTIGGKTVRWSLERDALTLEITGTAPIRYLAQLSDREMTLSGGDLARPATFALAAPATPATRPRDEAPGGGNPLVGRWSSDDGPVEFGPDGTGTLAGRPFRYRLEPGGNTFVAVDAEGKVTRITFQVDPGGSRILVSAGGEQGVLTRVGADDGAAGAAAANDGIAGVYVAQESSVDPTNAMVLTQYLTLYPDGQVGWAKSEMGASRQAVGEHLERFSSFRTAPDRRGQTYGTWQSDAAGNVVVRWRIWNGLTCRGRLDRASGALLLEKMGTLEEGATLKFERQK